MQRWSVTGRGWSVTVRWLSFGSSRLPVERITETDSLTITWEVAEELSFYNSIVIQHLKQIEKVKNPSEWVRHELTANLKNHHFEVSSSLIICNSSKLFHGLWYAMKSFIQLATTQKKPQRTSQSQTCAKK